jgi:hypothetical protein
MDIKKKKKIAKPFIFLHECMSCGNQWDAPFEVKHCFKCGIDERLPGPKIKAIRRIKTYLTQCSDGEWRIPLKLKVENRQIAIEDVGVNNDGQEESV